MTHRLTTTDDGIYIDCGIVGIYVCVLLFVVYCVASCVTLILFVVPCSLISSLVSVCVVRVCFDYGLYVRRYWVFLSGLSQSKKLYFKERNIACATYLVHVSRPIPLSIPYYLSLHLLLVYHLLIKVCWTEIYHRIENRSL